MGWFVIRQILSVLLELIVLRGQSDTNKGPEILLLRRQLAMVERKLDKPLRVSRAEKLSLAVLAMRLKANTGQSSRQMRSVLRIFQPETVFRWHRELVRRKWTHNQRGRGGRPRTDKELERLVVLSWLKNTSVLKSRLLKYNGDRLSRD